MHIQAYLDNKNSIKLTHHQSVLLKKLVDTSMRQYFDTGTMQHDLYKLFFEDSTKKDQIEKALQDGEDGKQGDNEMAEDGLDGREEAKLKALKQQEEAREEKKRRQLKLDGDLLEFEDRGGFA